MIITTSICANYLPKARILGASIKKYIPDAIFVVCLTERELPSEAVDSYEKGIFDRVVLAKHLGLEDDFDRFMFKHSIVEASTSIKGILFKHLISYYRDEDKFIYLDPDMQVFSDLTELRSLLDLRPVVLCPHLLKPGHLDMEISSIKYGVYNLGFLAVNRSEEALKFIDWWAERLFLYCYDDLQNGLFTDQRWVDLAPTFFDVELLKHYGYDFGTWAVKDVSITKDNGFYHICGQPLRCAHFSGFDGGTIEMVKKWWLSDQNLELYIELTDAYAAQHKECDYDSVSKIPWSYGAYFSGEKIDIKIRRLYRMENKLRWEIDNPFNYSNKWLSKKLEGFSTKGLSKWSYYHQKAMEILREHGLRYLVLKICKWCYKKISNR